MDADRKENMNIGFLLPYLMLTLAVLDEHYAMLSLFFFIIPLLDVMFYVEPDKKALTGNTMGRICSLLWFPLVFYASYFAPCSWQSMVSFGVLHNISLCLADELSSTFLDRLFEEIIYDYVGFFRFDHFIVSFTRFMGFLFIMLSKNKLLWHLGSIFIGTLLNEYVNRIENWQYYFKTELSHYGMGNYVMFRCKNAVLLPTSHMWVLPHLITDKFFHPDYENGLKDEE